MSSGLRKRVFRFYTPWPGTWRFHVKNMVLPATPFGRAWALYSPKGDLVFFDAQEFIDTGDLSLKAVEDDTRWGPWNLVVMW